MNSVRKIVWIAHLDNEEISSWFKKDCAYEFAPWIWEFAMLFKDEKSTHITLLVPYRKVRRTRKIKYSDSLDFVFFPDYRIPGFGRLSSKLNSWFNFPLHTWRIKSIVNSLCPDLIHLFGAENPHYAFSALILRSRYPIYLTIQGIVEKIKPQSKFDLYRIKIEREILRNLRFFGTRDEEMETHIKSLNQESVFLRHSIAIKKPRQFVTNLEPKYDLAFFARIEPAKGIEDVISMVQALSREDSSFLAIIMGKAEPEYELYLKQNIKEIGIERNIVWKGVLPSIDMVHENVLNSKIVVLPTYSDTIPGTILESLQLKIPVLSYNVGGIPQLNSNRESVKIVNVGDVSQLIEEGKELINSREKRMKLVRNGTITYEESWGDSTIRKQIINNYDELLTSESF